MGNDWLEFVEDTLDRSTLQGFRDCPRQARFKQESPVPPSLAMEAGNAVHHAMGAMVGLWQIGDFSSLRELVAHGEAELANARPDLVAAAMDAAKGSLWPFAKWLERGKPGQVLRWDGGKREQSGQLSRPLESFGATATSELDILCATDSPEVLEETDIKSGYTPYAAASIKDDFQFRLHWWLVKFNYPEVRELWVRVWLTRERRITTAAVFRESDLEQIELEVMASAGAWYANATKTPIESTAHPLLERCERCPFAAQCSAVGETITDKAKPEELVDRLAVIEAEKLTIANRLKPIVDASGDIRTANGNVFGTNKPTTSRKRACTLYQAAE